MLRISAKGADLEIGEDTGLSGTVICAAKNARIGHLRLIGADVLIFNTDFHNPEPQGRRYASTDWDRVSAPVAIGGSSMIGADSVVVSDIPQGSIAAGSPARTIRAIAPLRPELAT